MKGATKRAGDSESPCRATRACAVLRAAPPPPPAAGPRGWSTAVRARARLQKRWKPSRVRRWRTCFGGCASRATAASANRSAAPSLVRGAAAEPTRPPRPTPRPRRALVRATRRRRRGRGVGDGVVAPPRGPSAGEGRGQRGDTAGSRRARGFRRRRVHYTPTPRAARGRRFFVLQGVAGPSAISARSRHSSESEEGDAVRAAQLAGALQNQAAAGPPRLRPRRGPRARPGAARTSATARGLFLRRWWCRRNRRQYGPALLFVRLSARRRHRTSPCGARVAAPLLQQLVALGAALQISSNFRATSNVADWTAPPPTFFAAANMPKRSAKVLSSVFVSSLSLSSA